MTQRNSTPTALVWLADGHVSDWVLNALVDAEVALLPEDVVSHVDTCEHCTDRLATMASTVFALGAELTLLAEQQAKQKAPFPTALFAAVFVLTTGFLSFSWTVSGRALVDVPHEILTVWRGLRLVGPFAAQQLGLELVVFSGVTTLAAAISGVYLARRHPFTRSSESSS